MGRYLVYMKNTTNEDKKFFISTKIKSDEFSYSGVFHTYGYWTDNKSNLNNKENKKIKEVFIPLTQIECIESLMYKQR